jgi:hypothetical protein
VVDLKLRGTHKLHRVFVDPTGHHVLLSATGPSGTVVLYAHTTMAEAKEMPKMKVRSLWDDDDRGTWQRSWCVTAAHIPPPCSLL